MRVAEIGDNCIDVYDRFCKEYKDSLGEEYKVPLCNLYK